MFLANKLNKGAGAPPATTDPQFNYVTMLLHGDGTNGAQNNTFLDSSTNNFTITRNGNTTQGSFSPYGSNWSNNFPAGSSYLDTPSSSEFTFGTGDFTIEFWINTTITNFNIMNPSSATGSGYWGLLFQSGNLRWNDAYNTTNLFAIDATAILNGAWHHVAICRASGSTKVYYDGVSQTTQSDSTNYSGVAAWRIGLGNVSGGGFNGYLSSFRVNKGTAVYTSNFTPSTTPLTAISGTSLLTCQSNRFIDNSANGFTLTAGGTPSVQRFNPFGAATAYSTSVIGGSGYFDGAGDSLIVGNPSVNSQLALGSNDFTIQAWVYPQGTGIYTILGSLNNSNGNGSYWLMVNGTFSGGGTIQFGYNYVSGGSGGNDVLFGTGTLPVNAWSFVAVTRSGSNLRGYVNGVQVGTTDTSIGSRTIYPTNQNLYVGRNVDSDAYAMNGYLSDVQLVNGTALYTGTTMTVPTAPLTAITNTALLCNMTNGAIFDNAMMNDLETVGNAQISTSVVKYGTGSIALDGTGDWLYSPDTLTPAFTTGDFTVEFWINPTNWSATYAGVVCGILTNSLWIGKNASNFVLRAANNTDLVSYGTMPTTGVWTHIAVTRSGTTARMFYDGTQVASATTAHNFVASAFYVGQDGGSNALIGYMDDIRITKGYARYTSNFTPPTAAFPNIGPV